MSLNKVREVYDSIRREGDYLTWDAAEAYYPYKLPHNALTFDNIAHVKREVTASGSHHWDRKAVRFFRGRTDTQLYGGRFWVESRQFHCEMTGETAPREYLVAWVSKWPESAMLRVEKLGNFDTLDKARRAARTLAAAVQDHTGEK